MPGFHAHTRAHPEQLGGPMHQATMTGHVVVQVSRLLR